MTAKPHTEKDTEKGDEADLKAEASPDTAEEVEEQTPEEQSPEEQIATLNDQLLRVLADLENTRRRAQREREDAAQYGHTRFARDILSVADNLRRALDAVDEETRGDLPDAAIALLEGVAATERELLAIFARYKITPLDPIGDKFDPNLHEAMFEAPDSDAQAGTVVQTIEQGYMIGDKLLRPARVGVASEKNDKKE